ncbi:uncharacterized protein [Bemisia tabaci]|uniref:uncharacterized protein n=1 Tax=Bemisia tabaci TaxID=7038 RepID=UPI003B285A13
MSNNSGCMVFTTPFKMLGFFFCMYLIPKTFAFPGQKEDEFSFDLSPHPRPHAESPCVDFAALARTGRFVDKTHLIKWFDAQENSTLMTAPKHFGKSTSLDMLRRFYHPPVHQNGTRIPKHNSSNYKLFTDTYFTTKTRLAVNQNPFFDKHFASRPVSPPEFHLARNPNMGDVHRFRPPNVRRCDRGHAVPPQRQPERRKPQILHRPTRRSGPR